MPLSSRDAASASSRPRRPDTAPQPAPSSTACPGRPADTQVCPPQTQSQRPATAVREPGRGNAAHSRCRTTVAARRRERPRTSVQNMVPASWVSEHTLYPLCCGPVPGGSRVRAGRHIWERERYSVGHPEKGPECRGPGTEPLGASDLPGGQRQGVALPGPARPRPDSQGGHGPLGAGAAATGHGADHRAGAGPGCSELPAAVASYELSTNRQAAGPGTGPENCPGAPSARCEPAPGRPGRAGQPPPWKQPFPGARTPHPLHAPSALQTRAERR